MNTAPFQSASMTRCDAAKSIEPKAGLIEDSGTTRATASGRQAVVWIATQQNKKPNSAN